LWRDTKHSSVKASLAFMSSSLRPFALRNLPIILATYGGGTRGHTWDGQVKWDVVVVVVVCVTSEVESSSDREQTEFSV